MKGGKTYLYHQDPGHGWIAVKRKELDELGIAHLISEHSYQRGQTVYLEEDGDYKHFFHAYKERFLYKPVLESRHTNGSSPIRSYSRYRK
jgi:hypothetical protein